MASGQSFILIRQMAALVKRSLMGVCSVPVILLVVIVIMCIMIVA